MLGTIRKYRSSIGGLIIVGFCAFLMVGFGLGGSCGRRGSQPVATVGKKTIGFGELALEEQQLTALYRQRFGEQFERFRANLNIRSQALENLVTRILLDDFISAFGLSVGKEQLQAYVQSFPYFQGGFSKSAYQSYLQARRMTGAQFEQVTRKELARTQLSSLFADLSTPTEIELRQVFLADNTKIKLQFVKVSSSDFEEKVNTNEEKKIEEVFEQRTEKYRVPRQVKFSYVNFEPKDYLDSVEVTEEDLSIAYEDNKSEFLVPKKVQLRQIFFEPEQEKPEETPGDSLPFLPKEEGVAKKDETVESKVNPKELKRELANYVLSRLDDGENFTKLVEEYSEDNTTRDKGGDMGLLPFKSLQAELRDATRNLDIGNYSDVIETSRGFHIIYLEKEEPARLKEFAKVKDILEKKVREEAAPIYAAEAAEAFRIEWEDAQNTEEISLKSFAEAKKLKVKSTEKLVSAKDFGAEVSPQLIAKALQLEIGQSETVELGNTISILVVDEIKETHIPKLSEIREKVINDYKVKEAKVLAKDFADKLLAELQQPTAEETSSQPNNTAKKDKKSRLAILAAKKNLKLETTDSVTRTSAMAVMTPGNVFSSAAIRDLAFTLSLEQPLAEKVFEVGGNYFLLELAERTPPDEKEFEKKLIQIKQSEKTRAQKRLMEALVNNLKTETVPQVNKDLL